MQKPAHTHKYSVTAATGQHNTLIVSSKPAEQRHNVLENNRNTLRGLKSVQTDSYGDTGKCDQNTKRVKATPKITQQCVK